MQKSSKETLNENRLELIVMTLELENGKTEKLRIYEEDDPLEVAKTFGEAHSLEEDIIQALAENIKENMKSTLEELKEKEKSVLNASLYSETHQKYHHFTPETDRNGVDVQMVNPKFKDFSPIYNMEQFDTAERGKFSTPFSQKIEEEIKVEEFSYVKQKPFEFNSERPKINSRNQYLSPSTYNEEQNSPGPEEQKNFFFKKKSSKKISPKLNDNMNLDIKKAKYFSRNHLKIILDNRIQKIKNPIVEALQKKKMEKKSRKNSKKSYESSFEKLTKYESNINIQNYFSSKQSERAFSQNRSTSRMTTNMNTRRKQRSGSVHDRLYQEAWYRKKKKDEISLIEKEREEFELKRKMIGSGKKFKKKITNRLYYDAMKKKKAKDREIKMMKEYQEMQEQREMMFKPKISEVSQLIASSKPIRYERPIEDYLISEGQKMNIRKKRAKSYQKLKSAKKFSHKPKINEISKEIVREREKENGEDYRSKFEKLYEDSFYRIHRRQELEKSIIEDKSNILFRPSINPMSRLIAETNNPNMSFYERMEKMAAEKLEKSRVLVFNETQSLANQINPETKKPFFQPLTGRSPRNRNSQKVDIGTYLYEKSIIQYQNKKEKKKERELTKRERTEMKKSNQISDVIIESKKLERSAELFKDMDSDEDGVISSNKITIENIPEKILMIISPVLIEMEEVGLELNFEDFAQAMDKLYSSLSIHERNIYLFGDRLKKEKNFDQDLTFKPKINQNTDFLVKKRKTRISQLNDSEQKNSEIFQFSGSKMSNNFFSPRTLDTHSDRLLINNNLQMRTETKGESQSNPLLKNLAKLNMKEKIHKSHVKRKKIEKDEKFTYRPKITKYKPKISHYL